MNDFEFKQGVLEHIKEQTGMVLELCDYFTDVKDFNGKPYFNVLLKDRTCNSREYAALQRLAVYSSKIAEIQPNGVNRVAIVCEV